MKFAILFAAGAACLATAAIADNAVLVQSTTSTKNAGLYDYILPMVKADTGITVNVVAVGTGAALKNAMNCDGDVLLVHSRKPAETDHTHACLSSRVGETDHLDGGDGINDGLGKLIL